MVRNKKMQSENRADSESVVSAEDRQIDLVVFDMTGTTVQDRGEVVQVFMAALDAHGVEATEDELYACRGLSKRDAIDFLLRRGHGGDVSRIRGRGNRIYKTFCKQLKRQFIEEGVAPISNAKLVFEWLHRRGIKTATTTGFNREITHLILKHLGWHKGLLDASVCADDVSQGRPAPYMIFRAMERTGVTDVDRVIKIGDTSADIEAGRHAGVFISVGVLSGAHTEARLKMADPDHLIGSVADLPELLQKEAYIPETS